MMSIQKLKDSLKLCAEEENVQLMTELTEDDIDAVSLLTVENGLNKIQDKKWKWKFEFFGKLQ